MKQSNEILDVPLPTWLRLKKYAQLQGMTEDAFRGKIKNGTLAEGVHYAKAPDGNLNVNWRAMDDWVENEYK